MRLLRPQKNQTARRAEAHSHQNFKFDKSTGQVYTETTSAIQCSDDRNWTQEKYHQHDIARMFGVDYYPRDASVSTQGGTRTLKDIAIQCLVQNISDVTLELISSLPLLLRREVWGAVKGSAASLVSLL